MKNFLLFLIQNRQLIFKPIIPYNLIVERSKAISVNLTFLKWQPQSDLNRCPCADPAPTTATGI